MPPASRKRTSANPTSFFCWNRKSAPIRDKSFRRDQRAFRSATGPALMSLWPALPSSTRARHGYLMRAVARRFRWELGSVAPLLPPFRYTLHCGIASSPFANIPTEAVSNRLILWPATQQSVQSRMFASGQIAESHSYGPKYSPTMLLPSLPTLTKNTPSENCFGNFSITPSRAKSSE